MPEIRKAGAGHAGIRPRNFGARRERMDALGHERFTAPLRKNRVGLGILSRYDPGPFRLLEEMQAARRFGRNTIVCGAGGKGGLAGAELKVAVKDFAERMKPHLAAAERAGAIVFLYVRQRGHWTFRNPTKEEARRQLPGRGAMDFTPARVTEEIKLAQRYLADCLARV